MVRARTVAREIATFPLRISGKATVFAALVFSFMPVSALRISSTLKVRSRFQLSAFQARSKWESIMTIAPPSLVEPWHENLTEFFRHSPRGDYLHSVPKQGPEPLLQANSSRAQHRQS